MEIKEYIELFCEKINLVRKDSIMSLVKDIKDAYENDKFIFY